MTQDSTITTIAIAVGGEGKRMREHFLKVGFSGSKVLFPINGKPLLSRYIEEAFVAGFSRVVLLLNAYADDIKKYIKNEYHSDSRIVFVESSNPGRRTVPAFLCDYFIETEEPFVYMDGNLVFDTSIFASAKKLDISDGTLISVFVSSKDIAPTHALFEVVDGRIISVTMRPPKKNHEPRARAVQLCSMGIMVLKPQFFHRFLSGDFPEDLDIVLEDLFTQSQKEKHNLVSYIEYTGNWAALHDASDTH